jgi:hypothetical protein
LPCPLSRPLSSTPDITTSDRARLLATFLRPFCKQRAQPPQLLRDHLRALAQRVEVDAKEVRIMGSKSELLRTLVAVSSAKTAGFGVPSFVPKWRARRDSNS